MVQVFEFIWNILYHIFVIFWVFIPFALIAWLVYPSKKTDLPPPLNQIFK